MQEQQLCFDGVNETSELQARCSNKSVRGWLGVGVSAGEMAESERWAGLWQQLWWIGGCAVWWTQWRRMSWLTVVSAALVDFGGCGGGNTKVEAVWGGISCVECVGLLFGRSDEKEMK